MAPAVPALIEMPKASDRHDSAIVLQADTDWQFIAVWIARHESPRTHDNYRRHIRSFMAFVGKPLNDMRLSDLQGYLATRSEWAPATRALATASIKSFFSFAQELGYIRFNIGKAVKLPAIKNQLAERIMAEADTMRMIALEPNDRNRALLTLTYGAGLRISEVCNLRWKDMAERERGRAGHGLRQGRQNAHCPAVGQHMEGCRSDPEWSCGR